MCDVGAFHGNLPRVTQITNEVTVTTAILFIEATQSSPNILTVQHFQMICLLS
jgi:hypothetical protein